MLPPLAAPEKLAALPTQTDALLGFKVIAGAPAPTVTTADTVILTVPDGHITFTRLKVYVPVSYNHLTLPNKKKVNVNVDVRTIKRVNHNITEVGQGTW